MIIPCFARHLGAKTNGNTSAASTAAPANGNTPVRTEGRLATYPGAEVVVSSERRGILESLTVKERQMVVKGQLIAHLRSHDIEAQIDQERARVAEIKADIRLYRSEAERYQKLYDSQVGTQQAWRAQKVFKLPGCVARCRQRRKRIGIGGYDDRRSLNDPFGRGLAANKSRKRRHGLYVSLRLKTKWQGNQESTFHYHAFLALFRYPAHN